MLRNDLPFLRNFSEFIKSMKKNISATHYIILINYTLFALGYIFPLNALFLNHSNSEFHQFLTSIFIHANFSHISGNMFFAFFFGKLIEEKIGMKKYFLLFILTGIFTNVVEFFINSGSNIYSMGASGAIFGLFSVSLLLNKRKEFKDWIEILVLGPFVISYMFSELNALGVNDSVSHSAHLIGVIIGPFIYTFLKRK